MDLPYRVMETDHTDDGRLHRAWVFTVNNYTDNDCFLAYELAAKSASGAVGAECVGTPHLQGVVFFDTLKAWSQVCALMPRAYVAAKSKHSKFHQWWNYCFKGQQSHEEWNLLGTDGPNFGLNADVYTWGECPADNRREDAIARALRNMPLCMARNYKAMDANILALQLRNYKYGAEALRAQEVAPTLVPLPGERGSHHEWHWGEPGCGKSYYVRNCHGPLGVYIHEGSDKWWDDYDYEPVVILDDVGHGAVKLTQMFKQVLDQQVFRVQVKGGMMRVRPVRVCISSNHHPSDIWSGADLAAILDRVRVYHWEHCRYLRSKITGGLILDCNGGRCPNLDWAPPDDLQRDYNGLEEEDNEEALRAEEVLCQERQAWWNQESDPPGPRAPSGDQAPADYSVECPDLLSRAGSPVRFDEYSAGRPWRHDTGCSPGYCGWNENREPHSDEEAGY